MKDVVEQQIVGILQELPAETSSVANSSDVAALLRKYLEKLPYTDLISINAIMYAGRDRNTSAKLEHYIDRCKIFTKDELVQSMLIRRDNLREFLNRGMILARSN